MEYISNVAEDAILARRHHHHLVGDRTRPRAIPLATLTMEKETLGFHNFYAWSSYISPTSLEVGLRFLALGADEAPR